MLKKKIISVPLENDNITNITYDVRPIISCIAKLRTPSKTQINRRNKTDNINQIYNFSILMIKVGSKIRDITYEIQI